MSRAKTIVNFKAIVPSDTDDIPKTDGIHVNGSGNVKMTMESGAVVTLYLLAGVPYPYSATRIWDADTTATGIKAGYFGWRNARA